MDCAVPYFQLFDTVLVEANRVRRDACADLVECERERLRRLVIDRTVQWLSSAVIDQSAVQNDVGHLRIELNQIDEYQEAGDAEEIHAFFGTDSDNQRDADYWADRLAVLAERVHG